MGGKKRYDAEFKREIAQIYLDRKRSAASLAAEVGVHENTIYKWVEQYEQDPEHAFPGSGHQKPDEEALTKAQRRIRELEREVEILKAAAAYFAKNGL